MIFRRIPSMQNKLHGVIALIFAPQATSTYVFALLVASNFMQRLPELAVASVFASIIPIISLLVYAKSANIDLEISDRTKRGVLFFAAILSFFMGFMILRAMQAPFIMTALMLAYLINTFAATLITHFDKISVHVWGISGPAVALLYQYGYAVFAAALLLAVAVGISRMRAKAHDLWQVTSALIVSVLLTAFVVYYLAPLLA